MPIEKDTYGGLADFLDDDFINKTKKSHVEMWGCSYEEWVDCHIEQMEWLKSDEFLNLIQNKKEKDYATKRNNTV
jgi:hypothetical protein